MVCDAVPGAAGFRLRCRGPRAGAAAGHEVWSDRGHRGRRSTTRCRRDLPSAARSGRVDDGWQRCGRGEGCPAGSGGARGDGPRQRLERSGGRVARRDGGRGRRCGEACMDTARACARQSLASGRGAHRAIGWSTRLRCGVPGQRARSERGGAPGRLGDDSWRQHGRATRGRGRTVSERERERRGRREWRARWWPRSRYRAHRGRAGRRGDVSAGA
jgi:hypothetical protein